MNSLETILANKENIFEHIFYEMEMFLNTQILLFLSPKEEDIVINIYEKLQISTRIYTNILFASNYTHIRNLLNFFIAKGRNNDINCSTILKPPYDPQLLFDTEKEEYINAKMQLSKTNSHLTKERMEIKRTIESDVILNPIRLELVNKIDIFTKLPIKSINDNYSKEYDDDHTKKLIAQTKEDIKKIKWCLDKRNSCM